MEAEILILGSGYLGAQLKKDLGSKALGVSRTGSGDLNLDLTLLESFSSLPQNIKYIVFAVSPNDNSVEAYKRAYLEILSSSIKYSESLKDLTKFIFISSTGVYRADDGSCLDELTEPKPLKETSKIILEAEGLLSKSSLNSVILRFGGIYGPGRERMIRLAETGQIDTKVCSYSNRIHVEDCSRVVQHALSEKSKHQIYIGVDDYPCDQREVLLWIREQLGLENDFKLENQAITGKQCSNKRLKSEGFDFKYPSFREGYLNPNHFQSKVFKF